MSCLSVLIERIDSAFFADVRRATPNLRVSVSYVCSVGLDADGYEAFMVKEGVFLLADGKSLKVVKNEL